MNVQIQSGIDPKRYSLYHAVYSDSNIYMSYNWTERVEGLASHIGNRASAHFICDGNKAIGGFVFAGNVISHPFIIEPYADRRFFWERVLCYAKASCNGKGLSFIAIPQSDVGILVHHFGVALQSTQRRMLRPTEMMEVKLHEGYYFCTPTGSDIPDIVRTVYLAHLEGYTSTVWKPDAKEVEKAIAMRFDAFSQTHSLSMSVLAKSKANDELAGVCIAGIYPDSPDNFATIHQVSVKPSHRRLGIAESMMRASIGKAHASSPVITLGVLVGNPAERLYAKLGFTPGPAYSELALENSLS